MTKLITRSLAVAAAAGAMTAAVPAFAQTAKVATINPVEAIFGAKALPTALQQIDTKYAAQQTTANNRRNTLQAQIKPWVDALDTNKDGGLDQNEQVAAVQAQRPQVKQIQDATAAAQIEVDRLLQPQTFARIYVFDQLQQRYNTSLDTQVRTKQIGLILPASGAVRSAPGTDLTPIVRVDVDKPLAIDPPAAWRPTREGASLLETYFQAVNEAAQQQAQQQQQGGAAQPPAPRPATGTPAPVTPQPARPAVDRNGDPIRQ